MDSTNAPSMLEVVCSKVKRISTISLEAQHREETCTFWIVSKTYRHDSDFLVLLLKGCKGLTAVASLYYQTPQILNYRLTKRM